MAEILVLLLISYLYSMVCKEVPRNALFCGLFGYSGRKPPNPMAIKLLAIDAMNRGRHSTGFYGNKTILKKAEDAEDFVEKYNIDTLCNSNYVIGHTRAATMGLKNDENAHPFFFGKEIQGKQYKVVGSHNGWLIEHNNQVKMHDLPDREVDSMSIYDQLLKNNLGFSSILHLEGAMALAFVINDERLVLYRRESKPLFIGETKDGIYYSSRAKGLRWIDIPEDNIHSLHKDEFHVFRNGSLVDLKYYGKPKVRITLDQSPSSWKTHARLEDIKSLYPHQGNTHIGNSGSSNHATPNKGGTHRSFNKLDKPDILGKIKSYIDEKGGKHVVLNSAEENTLSNVLPNGGMWVCILVKSSNDNSPIENAGVCIDICPEETLCFTNKFGVAVLNIPAGCVKRKKCRVLLTSETSERDIILYSKAISLSENGVLEVALSINPFPYIEEEQKKNGDDSSKKHGGGRSKSKGGKSDYKIKDDEGNKNEQKISSEDDEVGAITKEFRSALLQSRNLIESDIEVHDVFEGFSSNVHNETSIDWDEGIIHFLKDKKEWAIPRDMDSSEITEILMNYFHCVVNGDSAEDTILSLEVTTRELRKPDFNSGFHENNSNSIKIGDASYIFNSKSDYMFMLLLRHIGKVSHKLWRCICENVQKMEDQKTYDEVVSTMIEDHFDDIDRIKSYVLEAQEAYEKIPSELTGKYNQIYYDIIDHNSISFSEINRIHGIFKVSKFGTDDSVYWQLYNCVMAYNTQIFEFMRNFIDNPPVKTVPF